MKRLDRTAGRLLLISSLALALLPALPAQVIIDVDTVRPRDVAPAPPAPPPARKPPAHASAAPTLSMELAATWEFITAAVRSDERAFVYHRISTPYQARSSNALVLDTFDAGSAQGSTRPLTTWVGQVTQNATSVTIGGTARNDNGWGANSLNLDASGLTFVNITAQRDPGHAGSSLFLQLEDRSASTNTHVIAIDTSLFAIGSPTTVQVPIGTWPSQFLVDAIGSWSIGGGGVGTEDFRMTLYNLELTETAIPEPGTVAAGMGIVAFGITLLRRRRPRSGSSHS